MNLLITKVLPEDQLAKIRSWGWTYDVIPTLQIKLCEVHDIPAADAWIISSRNSLDAVMKFRSQAPKLICVVGAWLKNRLHDFADVEVKSFPEMKPLASEMASAPASTIVYFCADNHRDELETALSSTTKKIIEVTTHTSRLTFPKLNDASSYDAIIVFSPRSVESLIGANNISKETLFASIGPTTDIFLKQSGFHNTVFASTPDSELLLDELYSYIQNKQSPNGQE